MKKSKKSRSLSYPLQSTLSPTIALVNAACRQDFMSFGRKIFHVLRVCPETSGGIAKFSEHEAD
jgi:hypothetical protein